jgi:hypothetical protein
MYAFHPLRALGRSWQLKRMQKPPPRRQPWEWQPLVRSRAIEWFCFGCAVTLSLLFGLGLFLHGLHWLAALPEVALIVVACFGAGLWNRRKRRREQAR